MKRTLSLFLAFAMILLIGCVDKDFNYSRPYGGYSDPYYGGAYRNDGYRYREREHEREERELERERDRAEDERRRYEHERHEEEEHEHSHIHAHSLPPRET